MRATWTLVVVLAAGCTPDIASGSYLCGPEQDCPDGMSCNGPDGLCVLPSQALPFACGPVSEVEPNDAVASAQSIGELTCVSLPREVKGCAGDSDAQDFFAFSVPAACTSVKVVAQINFPLAFVPLAFDVVGADGGTVATGSECAHDRPDDGDTQLCLESGLTPGASYTVRVSSTGADDCDGECTRNRYRMNVQLATGAP